MARKFAPLVLLLMIALIVGVIVSTRTAVGQGLLPTAAAVTGTPRTGCLIGDVCTPGMSLGTYLTAQAQAQATMTPTPIPTLKQLWGPTPCPLVTWEGQTWQCPYYRLPKSPSPTRVRPTAISDASMARCTPQAGVFDPAADTCD